MRVIKFRLFDNFQKKYIDDGWIIYPNGEVEFPESGWDLHGTPYKDCVLEQFTGLLDKNGKEIYEGDILICERSYWINNKKLLVKWDEDSASFFLFNKNDPVDSESFDRASMFLVSQCQREVIGTIHDKETT